MKRAFLLWLTAIALLLAAHKAEAVVDRDCGYTQGTTSTQTGFNGCDEEIVELYRRAPKSATGVSGTNTISLTFTPAAAQPATGDNIIFTAAASSTNTVFIAIEGGAPANAANEGGTNLGTGDITSGQTYMATFDGTKWRVIVRGGGGGGGAPTGADYVTLSPNGSLSAERVLTAGTALGLTDAGANSTITVAVNDGELTSIAGLTSAADRLPYYTGSGTAALAIFTGFGRSVLDDADAAAAWATITGDEFAQDAIGTILTDGTFIDFTYNDGGPTITATIIAGSITATELGTDSVSADELNAAGVESELEAVLDLADLQGSLTLAGDVDGAHGSNDLDEVAVESELESVLDLADLQGDLPLGTKTSGNYVDDVTAGTGITVTHTPGEGSDAAVGFDFGDAGASPVLGADECRFTSSASVVGFLVCEGGTANTSETRLAVTNPTADRVMTIPDADSNPVRPFTCAGSDKVSEIAADGTISCSADAGAVGSGDNIRVEDGNDAGTYTDATDVDFEDSGDINWVLATGTSPDTISATIRADAVALTTDTTGSYVQQVADGTGIDGSVNSEGGTYTPTLDLTEISSLTWGAGSFTTMTFDAGATDPVFTFGSGTLAITNAAITVTSQPLTADDLIAVDDVTVGDDLLISNAGVINFNSGDCTLTEGSDTLTIAGTCVLVTEAAGLQVGASVPFSDAAGTLTLQNVDAIDGTTETSIETAIDTLANLTSVQSRTVTLADAGANAFFGWDDTAGAYENLTDAEAEAIMEPLIDTLANLTSIQGRTVTLEDNNLDQFLFFDDSAGAVINATNARIATEASPAAGDFILVNRAEGDAVKVNWSSLPGAAGGDSVTINGAAVTDPDLDNATPAAPAGGYNVKWQLSGSDVSAYLDFTGATDLTDVNVADSILINDASASNAVKEATVAELLEGAINTATEDTAPNHTDDFIPFYDQSAGTVDKVNPEKIGAGTKSIALLASAGTLPSGGAIAACTMVSAFDSGSNDVFLRQCSFSAGTDQAIYWTIPAPKSSDETVDLQARVDWTSATTTDATDDVTWTMACVAFSNDDAINGNAFPTVDTVTDTQTAAGDFLSSSNITTLTPAGTWAEGDMLVCRLTRDADAAGDNFNGTADLINVQLFVTTNVNTDN